MAAISRAAGRDLSLRIFLLSGREREVGVVALPSAAAVVHPIVAWRPVPPLAALIHQSPVAQALRVGRPIGQAGLAGARRIAARAVHLRDAATRDGAACAGVGCADVDPRAGAQTEVGCR